MKRKLFSYHSVLFWFQVSSSSYVLRSLILSVDHQISFSHMIRSNIYVVRLNMETYKFCFALIVNQLNTNLLELPVFVSVILIDFLLSKIHYRYVF
jgi:hypothetical protein